MSKHGAFVHGLMGAILAILLIVCLFMVSNIAFAAEAIPTREAYLGEQDREIPGYEAVEGVHPDGSLGVVANYHIWLNIIDPPPEHYEEIVAAAKSDMTDEEFIAEVLKMIKAEKEGKE